MKKDLTELFEQWQKERGIAQETTEAAIQAMGRPPAGVYPVPPATLSDQVTAQPSASESPSP